MKRIVDIDEKDYEVIKRECSNKDVVPIGWVQILNGKPLQAELEEIKADIIKTRDMIPNDGDFCLGVKTGNTNDLVILDKYIEESNNEKTDNRD